MAAALLAKLPLNLLTSMFSRLQKPFVLLLDAISTQVCKRGSKLLKEGFWVCFGQLAAAVGALLGVRLLTEFINPESFGAVSLILGLILLGSNLTCAPLFQAVLRLFPEAAASNQVPLLRATVRSMLWKTTLGLLIVLAIIATVHCFVAGRFIWLYLPFVAIFAIDTLRGLNTNFLSAARRHRPFAIWNAYEACGRPLGAVAAVLIWGPSPEAVLTGYALCSALGCLLNYWRSAPQGADLANPPTADESLQSQITQYARPLVPLALVVWVSSLSDRYILGSILSLEQVGIYAAAYGLISRPFLILGHIMTLTLRPIYFQAFSQLDRTSSRRIFTSWLAVTTVLAAFGVAGTVIYGDWMTSWLLAKQYRSATTMLPWIACGYAFYVLANVFEQALHARKQTAALLKMHVAVAGVSLLMAYAGVRCFGLLGAALACPVYFFFHLACAAYLAREPKSSSPPISFPWNWKLSRPDHPRA